jgi:ribosomal protein S14
MGSPLSKSEPFTLAEVARWLRRAEQRRAEKPEPRRCPICGCYQFVYQGDRQVCRDCGRE